MKLLIVDDLPINRKLLRVTLESDGHTVLDAGDGEEALRILNRPPLDGKPIDGIVSDILMPGMDGYRLCNEIRASAKLRDLPFVFYTSTFNSPEDEQLALSVGADKYLTKPAAPGAVVAALQAASAMRRHRPQADAVSEMAVLRVYNDRLLSKLEEKNLKLERELRLSALSIDIGAALMHGKTLPEILRRCAAALVLHLDALSVAIWTRNESANTLKIQASATSPMSGAMTVEDRFSRHPVERIAKERRPFFIESSADCSEPVLFAGYPLIVGARLFGVIAIYPRHPISEAAAEKLPSIADAMALGIERSRADEELRQSLAEQTALVQEVHHRVKNNLQVVCSLLSMQMACSADSRTGPLNDAHARVVAMSLIHEQIYQSEKLADLDFGEYIGALSSHVFHAYCLDPGRIRLELNVVPVRLTLDRAIPCGLILNEMVSNSLKHGFPGDRHGTIRIALTQTASGYIELSVSDDGIGFGPEFRWEETHSLGLKVVRMLTRQLGANLTVSGEGGGAFRFGWQLSERKTADPEPVPTPATQPDDAMAPRFF